MCFETAAVLLTIDGLMMTKYELEVILTEQSNGLNIAITEDPKRELIANATN